MPKVISEKKLATIKNADFTGFMPCESAFFISRFTI